jgi:hypothetical protein
VVLELLGITLILFKLKGVPILSIKANRWLIKQETLSLGAILQLLNLNLHLVKLMDRQLEI